MGNSKMLKKDLNGFDGDCCVMVCCFWVFCRDFVFGLGFVLCVFSTWGLVSWDIKVADCHWSLGCQ